MILVSSCLAGVECRYNGSHSYVEKINKLVEEKSGDGLSRAAGGFQTPREPAEIIGGTGEDVLDGKAVIKTQSGNDVTDLYIKGAYQTLEMARQIKADTIVLKENSPSCSVTYIRWKFLKQKNSRQRPYVGTSEKEGFRVISEHQIDEL